MIKLILTLLLLGQTETNSTSTGEPPSLDQARTIVVDAWKRREKKVQSGQFTWTQTDIVDMPNRNRVNSPAPGDAALAGNWSQDETIVLLAFDGEKRRYERSSQTLIEGFPPYRYLMVKKPDWNIEFTPLKHLGKPADNGHVKRPVHSVGDKRASRILGLFLKSKVGPLDKWDRMQILNLNTPYKGTICWLGRFTHPTGVTDSYWFSPAHDYLPLHVEDGIPGVQSFPYDHVDFEYQNNPDCGWVPSSCTERSFTSTGQFLGEWRLQITDCQINKPLPQSTFEFNFPAGTLVYDDVQGKSYIQREHGEKRWITESDKHSDWADLVATESGQAANRLAARKSWSTIWLILFNSIALGLPLFVLCYLKIRASKKHGSSTP